MSDGSQAVSGFDALIKWATGSTATSVSFGLNIVMLILTVIGLVLYFRQKTEGRLLSGMLQEYGLKTRLHHDTETAKEERARITSEIEAARQELRDRLPKEAKRAYLENMIPLLQQQIFDTSLQLRAMMTELEALGGHASGSSRPIEHILSQQIRKHVSVRRDLERSQALLAILTGSTAAIGFIVPSPFNLVALPLAIVALRQCFIMLRLWRVYYGRSTTRRSS